MAIKYFLELVVKAQGDEGVTTPLLPSIQLSSADSLASLLVLAKYTAFGTSEEIDSLDDSELPKLAAKVEQDVADGKYKWTPIEQ